MSASGTWLNASVDVSCCRASLTGMAMKASNSRTGYSVQLTFPAGDDQLTLLTSLQQALNQLKRSKA